MMPASNARLFALPITGLLYLMASGPKKRSGAVDSRAREWWWASGFLHWDPEHHRCLICEASAYVDHDRSIGGPWLRSWLNCKPKFRPNRDMYSSAKAHLGRLSAATKWADKNGRSRCDINVMQLFICRVPLTPLSKVINRCNWLTSFFRSNMQMDSVHVDADTAYFSTIHVTVGATPQIRMRWSHNLRIIQYRTSRCRTS